MTGGGITMGEPSGVLFPARSRRITLLAYVCLATAGGGQFLGW